MTENSEIFVVGGGPSLSGFDYTRLYNKPTIAINHSVFDIPNPDYFITMDYLWLTKSGVQSKIEYKWDRWQKFAKVPQRCFILCFSPPRMEKISATEFLDTESGKLYDLNLFNFIIIASEYGGLGTTWNDFRCGSDSGYAALQLAIMLGYKKIYLLGLDYINEGRATHARKDCCKINAEWYKEKLNEFLSPYIRAFEDIDLKTESEVISCSPISRLNAYIPYKALEDIL